MAPCGLLKDILSVFECRLLLVCLCLYRILQFYSLKVIYILNEFDKPIGDFLNVLVTTFITQYLKHSFYQVPPK